MDITGLDLAVLGVMYGGAVFTTTDNRNVGARRMFKAFVMALKVLAGCVLENKIAIKLKKKF